MQTKTIELQPEFVDSIVVKELEEVLENFEKDLDICLSGLNSAVYSIDPKEEVRELCIMIESLKRVLQFYGAL